MTSAWFLGPAMAVLVILPIFSLVAFQPGVPVAYAASLCIGTPVAMLVGTASQLVTMPTAEGLSLQAEIDALKRWLQAHHGWVAPTILSFAETKIWPTMSPSRRKNIAKSL